MDTPTQPDKPEACPTTQPQGSQLSRDALLIHGLALVFAGAAVGTSVWLVPRDDEYVKAGVVGVAAALVLIVWSIVLAVRALWRGQAALWPAVVLGLCSLEATAVCLLILWNAVPAGGPVLILGLAIFIPVFVLASWVGVLVAWWRVRRAEKREREASTRAGTPVPPWPRRRRWKRGRAWYFAVTALISALLLPLPFYLVLILPSVYNPSGWQGWTARHTPVVLGEAAASLLSSFKGRTANVLYEYALSSGRVAPERLLSELNSGKRQRAYFAFDGLYSSDPAAALKFVTTVANRTVPRAGASLWQLAGMKLGQHGSVEQIRPFLDPSRKPQPKAQFLQALIRYVDCGAPHRNELLPDLERFCRGDSPSRAEALKVLARSEPPQGVQRLWAEFLSDSDAKRRALAINALGEIPDENVRLKILLAAFERRDMALQRELLNWLGGTLCSRTYVFFGAHRKLQARLTRTLLPLLDEQDLGMRRAATSCLSRVTSATWPLQRQCETLASQTALGTRGAAPPDSPGEHELIKEVREGAMKWLQENEK